MTQNTILALAALLVAVLVAEVAVRAFAPQVTYKGGEAYRDEEFFDLKPNFSGKLGHPDYEHSLTTDSNRFRKTWDAGAGQEARRILVVGDSFVFGTGVEDNQSIPSLLAKNLDELSVEAQVWNGGVPAYSLSEVLCKFEIVKELVRPDTVIVVAAFNDVLAKSAGPCDETYHRKRRLKNAPLVVRSAWWHVYSFMRDALLGHSQLFVFLAPRLNGLLVRSGLRASFVWTMNYYDTQVPEDSRALLARKALVSLKTLIDGTGARSVFVYLPGYLEVKDELWKSAVSAYSGNADRSVPRDQLIAAAESAGFARIIDLSSEDAGKCADPELYFPLDMHLNVAGTTCVAAILTRELVK